MLGFGKSANKAEEDALRIRQLEAKLASAEAAEAKLKPLEAKVAAILRSQAVIEFNVDGTIITANENFLSAVGYTLGEIVGRNHSMFVEREYSASAEYAQFWTRLNRGEYIADKFRRYSKSGKEIWIQASYNPLFDDKGKVCKVTKFATDVTATEEERRNSEQERSARAAEQAHVVGALAAGLRQLADGNLAFRLQDAFVADYEQLRADFNAAITKLQVKIEDALKSINESADAVRSSTADMSHAADELSRRTEQQAAALEESAAALAGITDTVHKTADGSKLASSTIAAARQEAEHSGEIVSKTVAAMQLIEESSRKVAQIIGVIDEIAFQTNLLALNAGVEAARAGDAGRGFAVVASEVRSLAQRAAEAAKEIKALISTSSQHVDTGAKLVEETGQALSRIVLRVNEINKLITNISGAAHEQASSLNQVNTAISEMDQSTQQNAAMVQESTAAIHALAQEADSMVAHLEKFALGQSQHGASSKSTKPFTATKSKFDTNAQVTALRSKTTGGSGTAHRPVRAAAGNGRAADNWEEF